jgi:hypothetical protein
MLAVEKYYLCLTSNGLLIVPTQITELIRSETIL